MNWPRLLLVALVWLTFGIFVGLRADRTEMKKDNPYPIRPFDIRLKTARIGMLVFCAIMCIPMLIEFFIEISFSWREILEKVRKQNETQK